MGMTDEYVAKVRELSAAGSKRGIVRTESEWRDGVERFQIFIGDIYVGAWSHDEGITGAANAITAGLEVQLRIIDQLREENAALRKVVDAAREVIDDMSGGNEIEFECGSVYRCWDLQPFRAALAAIPKSPLPTR